MEDYYKFSVLRKCQFDSQLAHISAQQIKRYIRYFLISGTKRSFLYTKNMQMRFFNGEYMFNFLKLILKKMKKILLVLEKQS